LELRAAYQRFMKERDRARMEAAGRDLIRAIFEKDAIAGDSSHAPARTARGADKKGVGVPALLASLRRISFFFASPQATLDNPHAIVTSSVVAAERSSGAL
jgi:hypothetical protein